MKHIPKILFVCLGNICRSPMAEGIFRDKAQKMGFDFEIDSCGTGGWHEGEAPDPRAQRCLLDHGLDISDLRARQFRKEDFDFFDIIFTMDGSNYSDVLAMATSEDHKQKVKLFLNESHPGQNHSVPDPYFGGDAGFESVYKMLTHAAEAALAKITKP